tara:strand:- start:11080 stop:11370 length:291 start_codon:yes stop_codon:yes gene_type:complete
MIDSQSLFRWGVGVLIGTGLIDFFRFGTIKLQTQDWLSVGAASVGLTMITLAGLDMALDKNVLKLSASSDYENIYLENDPDMAVIDDMAGLSVEHF